MVRVKAPLFSLAASGTIGKAIVYSTWKGVDYVRRHAIPSNPKEPMQVAVRAMLKFLSQAWSAIPAGNKSTWDAAAAANNVSPFNAYVGKNMFRHRNNLPPGQESDFLGIGAGGSAPVTTPTGGVRQATLSIADSATPPTWGWMIHRGLTGFTPSWANVIAAIPRLGTPTIYVDTPLTPATYYYRVKGFADDGIHGTLEVERSAVVT